MKKTLRLVAISDTHNQHSQIDVPDGDVLIHAGDSTGRGDYEELWHFNKWLGTLPHKHKLVIAGNHDFLFERHPDSGRNMITNATYLEDEAAIIEGVKFYGSPWQPDYYNWAFNRPRGRELAEKWRLIPNDTHVLITHGPPYGVGDKNLAHERVGCRDLMQRVLQVRPKVHIFGHIHEGYGIYAHRHKGIRFINASTCDRRYQPVNPPVVYDLEL